MKSYKSSGDVLELTAPAALVVDVPILIDQVLVVPLNSVASGARFSGQVRGVIDGPKVATETWTEGEQINWDVSAKLFTTVVSTNFLAGFAAEATLNPSATGEVYLNGVGVGAVLA